MTKQELDLIAEKIKLDESQRRACFLHLIAKDTVYEAEKVVYGAVTNTIGRVVRRVNAEYDFIQRFNKLNTSVK